MHEELSTPVVKGRIRLIPATKDDIHCSILLADIPIGTPFYGRIQHPNNPVILLLRVYGGCVSLKNCRDTWDPCGSAWDTLTVHDYKPVHLDIRVIEGG